MAVVEVVALAGRGPELARRAGLRQGDLAGRIRAGGGRLFQQQRRPGTLLQVDSADCSGDGDDDD